jgi:hypothetical protein
MHYEYVGGVAKSLDFSAEATFLELRPDQQRMCESLFRALATRDERGYHVRRPRTLGNLAFIMDSSIQEAIAIATAFSRRGFLYPSVVSTVQLTADTVLDICHEALLRNWRRLAHWIDEEHKLAEEYQVYLYLARKASIGQPEFPPGKLGIERTIAFRENHLVSRGWASQYGAESDYQAVIDYLSENTKRSMRRRGRGNFGPSIVARSLPSRRKIFICYRRDDSSHPADRIVDGLTKRFPREDIFYDIDSIPAGLDFSSHILDRLKECAVLLALIGNHWIDARFEDGPRTGELRIDDPTDFVRVEIETALREGVRVIPVLVGARKMPASSQLPETLQKLASVQAFDLPSGVEFNDRLNRLAEQLRELIPAESVFGKVSWWFTWLANARRH